MDLPLLEGFVAAPGRFLVHVPTQTILVSDLHLGVEAALRSAGVLMPDFSAGPLRAGWQALLARKPKRVVIAGDFFHDTRPSADTLALAHELLTQAPCPVTVLPGNHDPGVRTLRRLLPNVEVAATTACTDWWVGHGHDVPDPPPAKMIVGHQHPAVVFARRVETVKMICFATCTPPGGPQMIILPAFSPAPMGSNLLTSRNWLVQVARPAATHIRIAGIVRERVLDFGELSKL